MALNRIWMPSPCYSNRSAPVSKIVLHTAEGARTIESLGNFFANGVNKVSSHAGADDQRGKIGEYVKPGYAAWTQANYNSQAVALELCGFASWSTNEWRNNHDNMLRNCADWIAEEAKRFGIPITRLNDAQAQGNGRGVCQHINLGAGGGGHVDCGPGFPMDYVLDLARGMQPDTPAKSVEADEMIYLEFDTGGSAALAFTNKEANGNHRVRLFSSRDCKVEVDLRTAKETLTLGYDAGPQGLKIPKDVKCGVVRMLNAPGQGGRIAFTISESS